MKRKLFTGPQRGFTLLEALIAMVVMALGLLAVAGLQITLGRNSELTRQRAEATRLAQEKMEELRSYQVLATTTGKTAYADIASSAASSVSSFTSAASGATAAALSTNTAYTRGWTVSDLGSGKWITLTVSWTDRIGDTHSVVLNSAISKTSASDVGGLVTGMSSTKFKLPKDRSLAIPFPAKDLGNGYSAYKPGSSWTQAFVFDNTSGLAKLCASSSGVVTDGLSASITAASCTSEGVVLSGNVRTPSAVPDKPLDPTAYITNIRFLNFTDYYNTNTSSVDANSGSNAPVCLFAARTDTESPHPDLNESQVNSYYCLIIRASGSNTWSGRANLIGATMPNNSSICRLTADYNSDGTRANDEHPLSYSGVSSTLQNQNFVIADKTTCPSNFANNPYTTTRPLYAVQHQSCSPAGSCASVNITP
jgi:type IV pilus modification protein PilV